MTHEPRVARAGAQPRLGRGRIRVPIAVPSPTRTITTRDVRRYVDEHVFAPNGAQRVGIELEWVTRAASPNALPPPSELRSLLDGTLPGSSKITFEPGGQLELSGPAHTGTAAAITAMAADMDVARRALASRGIDLVGIGLDPTGLRNRVTDEPRYAAMEAYFDAHWPTGRTMMRNTAAVQVNVDLGDFGAVDLRWQRAHDLAPVLAAAFANSPVRRVGRAERLAVDAASRCGADRRRAARVRAALSGYERTGRVDGVRARSSGHVHPG